MPCDRPEPTRPQAAKGKNHPMIQRLSKIACVAAMALFASLVAFGNITDYGANLPFVQHVLAMDTIFPDSAIHYRAINTPWLQHAAYVAIILLEPATALLCWLARKSPPLHSSHHCPTPIPSSP